MAVTTRTRTTKTVAFGLWCCGPPGSGAAADGGEGEGMSREAKLMERKRARRAEARGIAVV